MLVLFYTNSVKVQIAWLLEKRELHSFMDGWSIKKQHILGLNFKKPSFFITPKHMVRSGATATLVDRVSHVEMTWRTSHATAFGATESCQTRWCDAVTQSVVAWLGYIFTTAPPRPFSSSLHFPLQKLELQSDHSTASLVPPLDLPISSPIQATKKARSGKHEFNSLVLIWFACMNVLGFRVVRVRCSGWMLLDQDRLDV